MAFSRVMRSDAYTPCGAAKISALCDCGISARKPCKKAVGSALCNKQNDKKMPERTAYVLSGTYRFY
jgi:hypothetical protein